MCLQQHRQMQTGSQQLSCLSLLPHVQTADAPMPQAEHLPPSSPDLQCLMRLASPSPIPGAASLTFVHNAKAALA